MNNGRLYLDIEVDGTIVGKHTLTFPVGFKPSDGISGLPEALDVLRDEVVRALISSALQTARDAP